MKAVISTDRAPGAIGPYSQGIRVGETLFISGQLPVDPATGQIVGGDIAAQTEQALRNVVAIVEAAGLQTGDVVKTTCLMADLEEFSPFNEAYARFFPIDPPARETYQVAALPRGARLEISAICAR